MEEVRTPVQINDPRVQDQRKSYVEMLPNGLELGIIYDPLSAKDYVCTYIGVGCSDDPKDLADTMNEKNPKNRAGLANFVANGSLAGSSQVRSPPLPRQPFDSLYCRPKFKTANSSEFIFKHILLFYGC